MGNRMAQVIRETDATLGASVLPDSDGQRTPFPELMTQEELVQFLRIPQVTRAKDMSSVIENLKRTRGLPRVHLCGKPLYPLKAIREWIDRQTMEGD